MRRIKSAPANIAGMLNKKNIIKSEIQRIENVSLLTKNLENEYKIKKDIANNKKKITTTISGVISDLFIETNKNIPTTDTYLNNYMFEFFNNFITNKFNRKNIENFILSLMIRFIANQVYHDIIIKIKENINLTN
jgi:hypothetical protein